MSARAFEKWRVRRKRVETHERAVESSVVGGRSDDDAGEGGLLESRDESVVDTVLNVDSGG